MVDRHALSGDAALVEMGRIIRDADVPPSRTRRQEAGGLDALIRGFQLSVPDDHEKLLLTRPLYDALYAYCRAKVAEARPSQGTPDACARDAELRLTPRHELRRRHRASDVVPLGAIAAHLLEEPQCGNVLDTLGDDVEPEGVGELNRRAHDRPVAGRGNHAAHERDIGLHLVQRPHLEVRERRKAGAEVVERNPNAQFPEVSQHVDRAVRVGQERASVISSVSRSAGKCQRSS